MLSHQYPEKPPREENFKSVALAKAPCVSSSAAEQELCRTKVISSITRNLFFTLIKSSTQSPTTSSLDECSNTSTSSLQCSPLVATGVTQPKPFPQTLMELLSQEDPAIVTWLPSGDAFIVRSSTEFVDSVLPKFFNQTKLTSFNRQLNLYGFRRIVEGPDVGAYKHELFRRDAPELCRSIRRKKRNRKKVSSKAVANGDKSLHGPRRVSYSVVDLPVASPRPSTVVSPSKAGCQTATEPSCLAPQPCTTASSETSATFSVISETASLANEAVVSLTGFSIMVCDHRTKTVAEVAHYSVIPCDLESFGRGVGNLLSDGIGQHKKRSACATPTHQHQEQSYNTGKEESCFPPCFPLSEGVARNDNQRLRSVKEEQIDSKFSTVAGNDYDLDMFCELLD